MTEDFLNMLKNKTKITLNSLTEDQVTTITSLIRCSRISNENKMCNYGMAYIIICNRKKN